ncbi:uncharacterized protein C8Q71DRAFT_746953 [Rhodofomes roseus]|uniref:Integrase core domain-containing protein n=1 Tax=Rhodofomes roseus TaxID=34475 RepID=A0ABQ8KMF6_9APHY|nr:uncharacterized protein C8Q71DRAFT_746953 [Rhodofomes roseus]KAH9838971.1 hypothetical protein C8Q71DRAFT_746953 [Rhodofomes roseus]
MSARATRLRHTASAARRVSLAAVPPPSDVVDASITVPMPIGPIRRTRGYSNNRDGNNQHGGKVHPLNDWLAGVLRGYYKTNVTGYVEIRARLREDHGVDIGRTKVAEYLRTLGLSVRKCQLPETEQTQLVVDEMERDPANANGPRWVKSTLALKGVHIPRSTVDRVMHAYAPQGFVDRHPLSRRKTLVRTPLTSVGPDEEWLIDGHDKLAHAGFGIYGIVDKWGGGKLQFNVLPSNRKAKACLVVYLRCAKERGGVPVQVTSDHGSETGDIFAHQTALRQKYAPELDSDVIPAYRYTSSPRNITVERQWRPLFQKWGVNVLAVYNAGRYSADFDAGNYMHGQLANWIWFPLMQRELDAWCNRENGQYIRHQPDKLLPSGAKRLDFYRTPAKWGGKPCLVPVPQAELERLLSKAEKEAEKDMEYVDEEYEALAEEVHAAIGKPEITLDTAWIVFRQMVAAVEAEA